VFTDMEPVTRFRTSGFLSDEARNARPAVRAQHSTWFDFCDGLNETGHRVLYSTKLDPSDNPALMLSILLGRLLSNFQGAVILVERLMDVEAKILARAALETTFVIRAVLNDPNVTTDLVEAEHKNRRVMREALLRTPDIKDEDRARLLKALEEGPKGKRINIEELARKADLHRTYELFYRSLSQVSHLTLGALEQYAQAGDDGEIRSLHYGPSENPSIVADILVPASFSMLIGLDGVLAGLKMSEFDSQLQELKAKYHELVPGERGEAEGTVSD